MVYASASDLQARWRPLSTEELIRADVLLEDAAARIDSYAPPPTEGDLSDTQTRVRLIISCEMVKRVMVNATGPGVTQRSDTAGPFTAQVTFANPLGDLYLTKADKRLLAGGRQTAGNVSMLEPEDA